MRIDRHMRLSVVSLERGMPLTCVIVYNSRLLRYEIWSDGHELQLPWQSTLYLHEPILNVLRSVTPAKLYMFLESLGYISDTKGEWALNEAHILNEGSPILWL